MVHTATILINTQPMLIRMAGGEGLEPSSTDLESIFLPIREPPKIKGAERFELPSPPNKLELVHC